MGLTSSAPSATSTHASYDATVDGVDAAVLVDGQGRDVNGFVVKANALAETGYGKGQAFMVLEEGAGDATDQTAAGSVMFRVDRHGNLGLTGGVHVATGLRNDDGQTQALWIDPSDNMPCLVITPPSVAEAATFDSDYISITDVRNSNKQVVRVKSTGEIQSYHQVVAYGEALDERRTAIGNVFGFAGISFGASADTIFYRAAAGIIAVANALQFAEMAAPAAPAANGVRLFSRDNGSGKTQLCCVFASGAVQVIATQP